MSRAPEQPTWTNRPEVGSDLSLRLMVWLTRVLGRSAVRLTLTPIACWFWLTTPSARRDSAFYLSRVLNRPATARDTFNHYRTFAATILDRVYFLRGNRELFDLTIIGRDNLYRHLEKGNGVLMIGAHMGSSEALRIMARNQQKWDVSMAMFEENAQKIGRVLRAVDPQLSDMIIPLGRVDSMLRIQARLDRGDMVGFLADRAFGDAPAQIIDFLGAPAAFPSGVLRMAAVLKRPVVAMAGLYLGGNRYELHFVELTDFTDIARSGRKQAIEQALNQYAKTLETLCLRAPFNWFNFFDFWATARQSQVHKRSQ
ncbi:MAG: acyl-CoA synthetase [Burkholderiaceae bacterium]